MPLEIIFLYHWLIAKEFEKTFPKDLQKQAKCGVFMILEIKKKHSISLGDRLREGKG
jgi:hypothetical protein